MTFDIPLLQDWLNFADANGNSSTSFTEYVRQSLSGTAGIDNVDVPGSTATALYSGEINDNPAFQVANDLADRSNGQLRIIDNTKIGQFLDFMLNDVGRDFRDFGIDDDYVDSRFSEASAKFAIETNGAVITITPNSDGGRVFSLTEIDSILKSNATTINGRDFTEIKAVADTIDDPTAKRAYVKAILDGDFARIVSQGDGNALKVAHWGAALDLDAANDNSIILQRVAA